MTLSDVLPSAVSNRGADMGRSNWLPEDKGQPIKLRLEALRFQDGDYDQGGAYWGYTPGSRVYCAYGQDAEGQAVRFFVRAHGDTAQERRAAAKSAVREELPNARFYC